MKNYGEIIDSWQQQQLICPLQHCQVISTSESIIILLYCTVLFCSVLVLCCRVLLYCFLELTRSSLFLYLCFPIVLFSSVQEKQVDKPPCVDDSCKNSLLNLDRIVVQSLYFSRYSFFFCFFLYCSSTYSQRTVDQ